MSDDGKQSPNLSANVEEEDYDDDNASQVSLSSASQVDEPDKEINDILQNEFQETLEINEKDEDKDELTLFILKAQQDGYNCLDLSKKNISEFPSTLLSFPSLQVKQIIEKKTKLIYLFLFYEVFVLRR